MVGPLIEASVSLMIMSLPSFLLLKPHRCSRAPSYTKFYLKSLNHRVQKFATHRDSVNLDNRQSPLSQSPLDTGRNRSQLRLESIGPFNLGTSQRALRGGEGTKKWKELSTGGKGSFSVHCPDAVLAHAAFSHAYSFTYEKFGHYSYWCRPCIAVNIYCYFWNLLKQFSDESLQGCLWTHQTQPKSMSLLLLICHCWQSAAA